MRVNLSEPLVVVVVVVLVVHMIQSNAVSVQGRAEVHRIRVAEHLGASSRRPRHPRALDDEELFIIEGSLGAQRPDGRSAKKARKTGEKPHVPTATAIK